VVQKRGSPGVGRRRVLQGAAVVGAATLTPALAAKAQNRPKVSPMMTTMTGELTADEVRSLLQLEPNATCGFVRLTFLSKQSIAAGGLPAPFADGRPLGSQRSTLPLLSRRSDRAVHVARRRRHRAGRRRAGPAPRLARAAADSGQYVSHRAADRAAPLVPGRERRVARRGAGRRGNRQFRRARRKISGRRRRFARDCRVG
jgi:hypothetical protein